MKTLFLLFVLLLPGFMSAQDNPFMEMADKKYADYSQALDDLYNGVLFHHMDTMETANMIRQVEQVAEKTGSIEWTLITAYFKVLMFDLKRTLYGNQLYPVEEMVNMALEVLEKTKKEKVIYLELIVRQKIIDYYWVYYNNYELAFELYAVQDELLQTVSSDDIPEKTHYYKMIADAYYSFKDYPKAIYYYNTVLEEKDNMRSDFSKQHARNGIGLSYRNDANADLDRSDSCFRAIMQVDYFYPANEFNRDNWNGIAEGNIGYNMILRGEYDKAIPLLNSSIEKMLKYDDYAYVSRTTVNLADIYLKKGNLSEAGRYLDLARDYYKRSPRESTLPYIYQVLSKYYAMKGNTTLSLAYMDSSWAENKRQADEFNALQLLRVEQRKHLSEQKVKDTQLRSEIIKNEGYRRSLLIALVGLCLFGSLLLLYLLLYLKKRAVCEGLYRQIKERDRLVDELETTKKQYDHMQSAYPLHPDDSADKTDIKSPVNLQQRKLVDRLHNYLLLNNNFMKPDIERKDIVAELATNKTYLFDAIKVVSGKSLQEYITFMRLEEARRMIDNHTEHNIEVIAGDCGFNTYRTFHRAFREHYKISPAAYRSMSRR